MSRLTYFARSIAEWSTRNVVDPRAPTFRADDPRTWIRP